MPKSSVDHVDTEDCMSSSLTLSIGHPFVAEYLVAAVLQRSFRDDFRVGHSAG